MLSVTLRKLVRDGLVVRRVEATVPPSVHYGLTNLGRSLDEPLAVLRAWAERNMSEIDEHGRQWDAANSYSMMGSPTDGPCRDWYNVGGVDRVEQQIRKAGDLLTQMLNEIHERSPEAKVLVVGYPQILPSTNSTCSRDIPVAAGDIGYLRRMKWI